MNDKIKINIPADDRAKVESLLAVRGLQLVDAHLTGDGVVTASVRQDLTSAAAYANLDVFRHNWTNKVCVYTTNGLESLTGNVNKDHFLVYAAQSFTKVAELDGYDIIIDSQLSDTGEPGIQLWIEAEIEAVRVRSADVLAMMDAR